MHTTYIRTFTHKLVGQIHLLGLNVSLILDVRKVCDTALSISTWGNAT